MSNLSTYLASSVRIEGVFQVLRMRFIENYDTGLRRFPVTVEENARLDSAIRSAMHIYGNVQSNSMTAESYAQAVLYIQEEMTAIRWIMNNPHFAKSVAVKELQRRNDNG